LIALLAGLGFGGSYMILKYFTGTVKKKTWRLKNQELLRKTDMVSVNATSDSSNTTTKFKLLPQVLSSIVF
jgi:hypothetical protein